MMSTDRQLIEEYKSRLSDRYTAAELADLLDIAVEDLIELYFDRIIDSGLLREVGLVVED